MSEPRASRPRELTKETLGLQLKDKSLDIVDLIPIPVHGDRIVRMRTLEELLLDFDGEEQGTTNYLITVRAARTDAAPTPTSEPDSAPAEHPYLADGKLNLPFLDRNAELLYSAREYTLARNIYRTILQSGERTAYALAGMARCFEAEGRSVDACAHYEESLAYHPSLDCYRRLATLLIKEQNHAAAADAIERALNLKEVLPEMRYDLHKAAGNCFARVDGIPGSECAERHFRACLKIDPSSDEIRTSLGALYLQVGRTSDAERSFHDALASNTGNSAALMGLGSCALALNEKREAHDYFARSLELELNNPSAIFYLVKCAYEIKSYVTAARLVEEFMEVAPVDKNLLYSLAGLQFHLGRLDEAASSAERILELVPNHAGAAELLGLIENAKTTGGIAD